jgi:hypothetical protein
MLCVLPGFGYGLCAFDGFHTELLASSKDTELKGHHTASPDAYGECLDKFITCTDKLCELFLGEHYGCASCPSYFLRLMIYLRLSC